MRSKTQAPAAAAGATTLDLSSGVTETNTGQKGGNTSLGTTNRIEIAAVHGQPNVDNDAYTCTKQLTDKPAGAVGIRVTMVCSTPDQAAAIGANAGLYLYLGTTAAPTSNQAYLSGWQWQNTGTRYRTHESVTRLGTVPGGTTVIDTQAAVGTLYHEMVVYLDETGKPTRAISRCWGEDGSTNGLKTGAQTAALSSGTDIYVGFCCDQQGATPGDVLDMQDVVFTYEWLT